jgi:Mg/Co/Ni transporter MgtE
MAVAVRGLALGHVDRGCSARDVPQLLVGCATGIVIGLMTATVAWIFHNDPHGRGKLGSSSRSR